jgi:putative restriction endonuclease
MAFGAIEGAPPGATYPKYADLLAAGVHRQAMKGIVGGAKTGAESIVLNGGYGDDKDFGDEILYTGEGGQDSRRRQITDQKWEGANQGLRLNAARGLPVRVIRGWRGDPAYSPSSGYRYDGLYSVVEAWQEPSADGPLICRFRMQKTDEYKVPAATIAPPPTPVRVASTVLRVVRDTSVALKVKARYDYGCQICGTRLALPGGLAYAEGAHIRPLSTHDGPDTEDNLLCLCPNHHVSFDRGALYLSEDLEIVDAESGNVLGPLRLKDGHPINREYVAFHRALFGF